MPSDQQDEQIESVDKAPICHGCGLVSHYISDDVPLCSECFNRRNWWQGGGQLRVVTPSGTYHETPLCPSAKNAKTWYYWRDESCCYADLGGDMDKCVRCHSHRTYGFDEYTGDEERQAVIGHA